MRQPEDELSSLQDAGLLRRLRRVEAVDGVRLTIDGRAFLNFSSNDYLGLSLHPGLREAAEKALRDFGAGSTASRRRAWCSPTGTRHRPTAPRAAPPA